MHVSTYTDMLYEYRWMSYDFRCLQGQKRTSDSLELESPQVVVSYLVWMLGLNSDPLKEHEILLSTAPSLQSPVCTFS